MLWIKRHQQWKPILLCLSWIIAGIAFSLGLFYPVAIIIGVVMHLVIEAIWLLACEEDV